MFFNLENFLSRELQSSSERESERRLKISREMKRVFIFGIVRNDMLAFLFIGIEVPCEPLLRAQLDFIF